MSKDKIYQNDTGLQAGEFRYGIVAARFNESLVDKLLQGAVRQFAKSWCNLNSNHCAESARSI